VSTVDATHFATKESAVRTEGKGRRGAGRERSNFVHFFLEHPVCMAAKALKCGMQNLGQVCRGGKCTESPDGN